MLYPRRRGPGFGSPAGRVRDADKDAGGARGVPALAHAGDSSYDPRNRKPSTARDPTMRATSARERPSSSMSDIALRRRRSDSSADPFGLISEVSAHQRRSFGKDGLNKRTRRWLIRRYWTATGRKWAFSVWHPIKGGARLYQVVTLRGIGLRWHRKVKAEANPYLPEYAQYSWRRRHVPEARTYGAARTRDARAATA